MSNSRTPLNIAIAIDDFYPASGGIGRSVETQINELARLGHSVTLISPKHYLAQPKNARSVVVPSFYLPKTPSHMCIIRYDYALAKKISSTNKFDIIHSQTERGALVLAAKIAKLQNIPHTHTFHTNLAGTHDSSPILAFFGSMAYFSLVRPAIKRTGQVLNGSKISKKLDSAQQQSPSMQALDWRSLAITAEHVDAFATPAKFMEENIRRSMTTTATVSAIIPTGVNPDLSEAMHKMHKTNNTEEVRFLSVCRLSKEKRVDAIVQAFLLANISGSHLDIVGQGDQLKELKKISKGSPSIHFHGHIANTKQLANLYVNADVFVLGSHHFDTQAISIAEAVTAGLPVIYCDKRLSVGVTPSNSILTEDPGPQAIADAMVELASKTKRNSLAKASEKLAPSLSSHNMANQYIRLYEKLLAKKTPGR